MTDNDDPRAVPPHGESWDAKVDRLSQDARAAGERFVATDTGRQVADATDKAFAEAERIRQQALGNETVRHALDSDLGRRATGVYEDAAASVRTTIPNELARNVAIGAAAGAVVAVPIPFIGSILGAVIGGGLGYLRTVTKKR